MMSNRSELTPSSADSVQFVHPERIDEPLISFTKNYEQERCHGTFAVELTGMVFNAREENENDRTTDQQASMGLITSVFSNLSSGEGIELLYHCGKDIPFTWRIYGHVEGDTPAEVVPRAKCLFLSFCSGIQTANAAFRFSPVRNVTDFTKPGSDYAWQRQIVSKGITIREASRNSIGFVNGTSASKTGQGILLPDLLTGSRQSYNRLAHALSQSGIPIELKLTLSKVILSAEEHKRMLSTLEWLRSGNIKEIVLDRNDRLGTRNQELIENTCKILDAWLQYSWGTRISVAVSSEEPVPAALLGLIAEDLGCGKSARLTSPGILEVEEESQNAELLNLQDCLPIGYQIPSVFPQPSQLHGGLVCREYNRTIPRFSKAGIILGHVQDGPRQTVVRFGHSDRSRHAYILGSTGTGKSNLLANMIVQDIRDGHGICVLDPHGDLYAQILGHIPNERRGDLVLINPCDKDRAAGINFLECAAPECRTERHFLVNEMLSIFQQIYLREHQGPMFETYMRNAMLLVMENDIPGATLLDIPLLFEDSEFRNALLAKCTNPMVRDFWQKTAERAHGEISLCNMTAYITSKLNMFIYNPLMRSIIGQAKSTVNFHAAMKKGQIVLVNLSKGLLGEMDTRLLGMLISGKIFSAALNRVSEPVTKRRPFFLYIDEFQNFTSDTVSYMMSEARKFGLYLTLANQNLTQLKRNNGSETLSEAVLSNTGTLLCLRTGAPDAERVNVYTMPEFDSQDIQYLPDFHVIAKLLVNNSPSRPFVFQTLPFESKKVGPRLKRSIEAARKRHTTDIRKVDESIMRRRNLGK